MISEQEIKEMPIDQKLRLMEAIWKDISRDSDDYDSPEWHREELQETEERLRSGAETLLDWEEAKKRLRNREDDV